MVCGYEYWVSILSIIIMHMVGDHTSQTVGGLDKSESIVPPIPGEATYHVAWLLPNRDVNSASTRYRCLHFARVWHDFNVQQRFFTDAEDLAKEVKGHDAIIIVKRLDPPVLKVVAQARAHKKAIFLDICDDILSERNRNNVGGVHRMVFAGIARYLDGVITPSVALSSQMQRHSLTIAKTNIAVHVIPDIAETPMVLHSVSEFALRFVGTGATQSGLSTRESGSLPKVAGVSALSHGMRAIRRMSAIGKSFKDAFQKPARNSRSAPSKVVNHIDREKTASSGSAVWFGNWGGPSSNFGIASLVSALPALRSVGRKIDFELVVISNNQEIFDALIATSGVRVRYVPWSSQAVYEELHRADVALLTSGSDEFSKFKSTNRYLLALGMGVPVVSFPFNPALQEFGNAVIQVPKMGLLAYLGPDRASHRAAAIEAARPVLERHSPENLASAWFEIMANAIAAKRNEVQRVYGEGVTVFIESGIQADLIHEVLGLCRKYEVVPDVIVTLAACKAQPKLLESFIQYALIPTVVTEAKHIYPHRIHGTGHLVVESKTGKTSKLLVKAANKFGVKVQTLSEWVEDFNRDIKFNLQPGAYAETTDPNADLKWTFIAPDKGRGWILEAICREIGSRQPDNWRVVYGPSHLPPSRDYFFSHHTLYLRALREAPESLQGAGVFVWYTHQHNETPEAIEELLSAFRKATKVIFTCSQNLELWITRGLEPSMGQVVLGGADPELFHRHERGQGVIGLSSSFYERKNPDGLLELVKMLKHRRFCLIGRRWEQYVRFDELINAPNFEYLTLPYKDYPTHYDKFDVFLSMSSLEGGPIPLLEAMMCNAVPVASNTGFAPDLISHGENGFIFDIDAQSWEIANLIERAFNLDADIRNSVIKYNWNEFSHNIAGMAR